MALNEFINASPTELRSGTGLYPRQEHIHRRQAGQPPPSIFGWLGSRLSRIPQLLRPRYPHYPPPPPRQLPQYESNLILPDPPNQDLDGKLDEEENELVQNVGNSDGEVHSEQQQPSRPLQYQQTHFFNPKPLPPQGPPPIEVLPSRMVSYHHHQLPSNQPVAQTPYVYNNVQNTQQQQIAYYKQNSNYPQQQQQQQLPNPSYVQQQGIGAEYNYGATFVDVQSKSPIFDSTPNQLAAIGGTTSIQSTGQVMQGMNGHFAEIQSLVDSASQASNTAAVQRPKEKSTSGLPGIQIISQGTEGENPVFELVADADAPTYDGHPFDISKLIAMIEPGAVIESPQLSGSESQTSQTGSSTSTGTDLMISESAPEPVYSRLDQPILPISLPDHKTNSSLKEIMQFFQKTDGRGHVIVERKSSRPTDFQTDFNQDNFDKFPRINITYESIPLQKLYVSRRKTANSYLSNQLRNRLITPRPQYSNNKAVYFAVKKTTRHPNHNYNNILSPKSVPGLHVDFTSNSNSQNDLDSSETGQVESIAITVTPPPNTKTRTPTTTTTSSTETSTLQNIELFFSKPTKSNVKKMPSPVFPGRSL